MKQQRVLLLLILLSVLLLGANHLFGQSFDGILGFGGNFSTALDLRGYLYGGVCIRFLPVSKVGIFLDLDFGRKYYQYEDGSWGGPFSWGLIDAAINRRDWLFYHTEAEATLSVVVYLSKNELQLYLGGGALLRGSTASGAAEYYPEFALHYEKYKTDLGLVHGFILKFGLDLYISVPWISYGAELNVRISDLPHLQTNLSESGLLYLLGESRLALKIMFWPVQRG